MQMRVFLLLFIGFMLRFEPMSSFQTPVPEQIVERCISAPTEPDASWIFEGTIMTFRRSDGIHGFRSDTPSRYYIAFDNDTEFGRFGAVSPDGQWFASFIGTRESVYSLSFSSEFFVTHVRVVSTQPDRETYLVPFEAYDYSQDARFTPIYWVSNTELAAYDYRSWNAAWHIVDPFEGTSLPVTDPPAPESYVAVGRTYFIGIPAYSAGAAINETRTIIPSSQSRPARLYIRDDEVVYDTCIDAESWAVSPSGMQVAVSLGDRDGFVYVIDLQDWAAYRLDLAANRVIAWVPDADD
ncbi:MAG: hypothetical protein KME04_17565 [Pleurocapsa minor GSE-CHR-MK-17-07R]|jgi:hypothetical protein|nr:hypothetical protein [Pleurocapsa minor GSE-CHR-MK 17-07R]